MIFKHTIARFEHALLSNAMLYAWYKASSLSVSWLLWSNLPAVYYARWGLIQATIYLALLWVDGGLRKSIPRYAPLFAEKRTFYGLMVIHVTLIIASCAALIATISFIFPQYITPDYYAIMALLYMSEGLLSLSLLIYHSQGKHKEFNRMQAIMLSIQGAVTGLWIMTSIDPHHTIIGALAIKSVASACISFYALARMRPTQDVTHTRSQSMTKEFLRHTAFMGGLITLKSLTERNFLMPITLLLVGPEGANLLKVTQEGTLFFQRTVLKTIGIQDTLLLSAALNQGRKSYHMAYKILMTKIKKLVYPLLGISCVLWFAALLIPQWPASFSISLFLITAHCLELLCMPSERMLEVSHRYASLIIAYIPYLTTLFITSLYAMYVPSMTYIGLIPFLIGIYSVRLVSLFIMWQSAYRLRSKPLY